MNVDLRGAFWTPSAAILGSASKMYERILRSIFANGEQGFAYDPNDLTTLFQDTAGTIPVTSAGQPVALFLDKSKGLAVGAEKVVNGDFTDAVGWSGTTSSLAISNGKLIADATSNASVSRNDCPTVTGRLYKVTARVSSYTRGVPRIMIGGSIFNINAAVGVHTFYIRALTTTSQIYIYAGYLDSGGAWEIDSISVKELAGNHAYQPVSASRPVMKQTPILSAELIVNGDFSNGTSAWLPAIGGTLVGTNGKVLLTSTVTGITQTSQSIANLAGKTVKVSCKFSNRVGNAQALIALWSGTATTGYATSGTATAGYLEFITTLPTPHTGTVVLQLSTGVAGNAVEFDDVSVKEVLGYHTDQNYLEFDGVDDFLQTNSIDFTATDAVSLFVGVRKASDATTAVVAELSTTSDNGKAFTLFAPALGGTAKFLFRSGGSIADPSGGALTTDTKYSAPFTAVAVGRAKISMDYMSLKLNGAVAGAAITYQGTGNYSASPLYIGRRAGLSLPFSGNLYGLIGVGRLTTDGETLALEREIAKQTGVVLNV